MSTPTLALLRWQPTDPDRAALADAARGVLASSPDGPTTGSDQGWYGIGVPEELGGCGGTLGDLAQVAEEIGVSLAATSAAWTAAIAGQLLARAAVPPEDLVADLVAQARPIAVPLRRGSWPDATSGRLDGTLVALGPPSGLLALPVRIRSGDALAMIDSSLEHVSATAIPSLDHTRALSTFIVAGLDVADMTVVPIADLHRRWLSTVGTVAALDAVGAARTALARTVDYSRTREQFGRPIGSFQAYKHRCATMFIELRLAQALAFGAADDDGAERGLAAGTHCARVATRICSEAVVLHGGVGFTWEAGLHAHLKRARFDEALASQQGDVQRTLVADVLAQGAPS